MSGHEIYILTKPEIVQKLRDLAALIEDSRTVCENQGELYDELGALQCHVTNRAAVELGRIEE